MTAYEILSTIQDAAAFLVSVGIFVVTLLAFLDQRNKHSQDHRLSRWLVLPL